MLSLAVDEQLVTNKEQVNAFEQTRHQAQQAGLSVDADKVTYLSRDVQNEQVN